MKRVENREREGPRLVYNYSDYFVVYGESEENLMIFLET